MNIVPAFVRRRIEHRPNLVKIVDNMGWLFFDKVLRMGVGLLVGVWVARYLGPEQFGLLSFASAFVGMFGAVAGLGLQSIVVRDMVQDPSCKEETLGTAAVLQLVGGLLAYGCVMGTIFWLRPDEGLAKLLVAILGSIVLFKFSDVALYWFESQVLSKYIVWVQNGCFLVFAAIKVGLIVSNAPLLAFAWTTAAEALIVSVLILFMLGLHGPKLQKLRFSLLRAKTLLLDSWPLLLSGMAIMVYMKIDQIMLGQMLDDDAVGIYSAAVRISEVWYFIPMMIMASVFPAILEAKKRDETQYLQRLQRLYDLMVWLSVAIALPMTFLSTPIVIALFGSAYAESGPVLAIHIWASVFVFLGVASSQWFVTENRQILSFQRTLLGLIINVLFNLFMIPKFGGNGAAVATLLGQITAAWLFDLIQAPTRPLFFMKTKSLNLIRFIQKK
ncbi:flippase [Limnohabitans sp. 2KL-27]|uniref:flippase n=1 Tax=Limnohabitans sp. 2KL-27 TaxID=1100705 RepID=UPI000B7DA317|nr:flippase [Limnohabitans sp. 2KL-27]